MSNDNKALSSVTQTSIPCPFCGDCGNIKTNIRGETVVVHAGFSIHDAFTPGKCFLYGFQCPLDLWLRRATESGQQLISADDLQARINKLRSENNLFDRLMNLDSFDGFMHRAAPSMKADVCAKLGISPVSGYVPALLTSEAAQ